MDGGLGFGGFPSGDAGGAFCPGIGVTRIGCGELERELGTDFAREAGSVESGDDDGGRRDLDAVELILEGEGLGGSPRRRSQQADQGSEEDFAHRASP